MLIADHGCKALALLLLPLLRPTGLAPHHQPAQAPHCRPRLWKAGSARRQGRGREEGRGVAPRRARGQGAVPITGTAGEGMSRACAPSGCPQSQGAAKEAHSLCDTGLCSRASASCSHALSSLLGLQVKPATHSVLRLHACCLAHTDC